MDDFNLNEWLHEDESPAEAVTTAEQDSGESKISVAKTLTTHEVRILSYCEQVFWESGLLPTPERVSEDLGYTPQTCRKAYQDETFRNQLAARGIDPVGLVTVGAVVAQTKALSPQQIVCANLMLNLHDKRSEREKLALINVSSQQYHAWLRQPQFQEFLRKRGEALFSSSDYKAYKSLVRNVEAGDNKSLELFFRMRGIYRPTVDVNLNIEAVLTRVIEVISTHVKDPKVLTAIANGIDEVLEAEEIA